MGVRAYLLAGCCGRELSENWWSKGVIVMYQIKHLNEVNLAKLQALERESRYCIVAFEQQPRAANFSEALLERLQNLEKEMDAVLVAYA